jgi:hypothetical protein
VGKKSLRCVVVLEGEIKGMFGCLERYMKRKKLEMKIE